MQVKKEKISERMFLVAVVDDSDLVVVAAAFEDEETAAQVFAFADTLLKKTGVIAGAEDFLPPFMPYSELRDSMLEFEGKEPIEKIYPMFHVINRRVDDENEGAQSSSPTSRDTLRRELIKAADKAVERAIDAGIDDLDANSLHAVLVAEIVYNLNTAFLKFFNCR